MNMKDCLLLLMVSFFSAWAVWAQEDGLLVDVHQLPAERAILVGFPDHHLSRIAVGGPGRSYRKRGTYQSSRWAKKKIHQLAVTCRLKVATQWPITELGEHCAVLIVPEKTPLDKVITELTRDQKLTIAQPVMGFKTQLMPHQDPYYPLQNNLHLMNIDSVHLEVTGKKITVALIDTGVDLNHPDLKGRIGLHKNFIQSPETRFSDEIHGTAMAGIIAAQSNRQGIVGVAPEVTLWPMRACWPAKPGSSEAYCNTLSLALALNEAIILAPNIINLSLTGPEDPLLRRLILKAVEKGIIVVAAKPTDFGPHVGFPADMEEVITVRQPGYIPELPGAGGKPFKKCIAAPGEEILTTFPNGTYNFISGSSASTAHISGLVALLLEKKADLSPKKIQKILWRAYSRQPLPVVDASIAIRLIN